MIASRSIALLPVLLTAALAIFAPSSLRAGDDSKTKGDKAVPPALNFTMKSITGQDVNLAQYQGKVVMMVNVASQCGYTPQYKGLEALYKKYGDKGFVILGFPANNFGQQEPGTDAEIKTFCESKFAVTFPMFSKISVKGDDQASLYKFLTDKQTDPQFPGDVKWNFEKFLISRDGRIVHRFASKVKPDSEELVKAVETELAK
jgi:glutathione peroxidase